MFQLEFYDRNGMRMNVVPIHNYLSAKKFKKHADTLPHFSRVDINYGEEEE
jgi:hypothetical protein